MASLYHLRTQAADRSGRANPLTYASSMREKVFEHLLLAQLGLELMARGIEFEVLHGETDRDGYDVVIEAGGLTRHMQLKVMIEGGARADVSVHTRLATKPAGCVVWLTFDPATRDFSRIRWFGSRPGEPLPDPGTKLARHSRANSEGIKAFRPDHRVLATSRFERLSDVAHLADRLFGRLSGDPLTFLRSRIRHDGARAPDWFDDVAAGTFNVIPADITWERGGAELASLIDGYAMLELVSDSDASDYLQQQEEAWRATGRWQGDAVGLWITLFLEARAERFGAIGFSPPVPHLDQLCLQLREALVALENADA